MDSYKLLGKELGTKKADDAWVENMSRTIYSSSRDTAADGPPRRWPRGSTRRSGEAISLAANRLVLHDPGRTENEASDGKPEGSVHGDSVGVHACDAANAWRNMAQGQRHARNTIASLIVGAYHTAGQSGGELKEPHPMAAPGEGHQRRTPNAAAATAERHALKEKDLSPCRRRTSTRYGELGHDPRAGVRHAAALRLERGRRAARGEVLPHGGGGVRKATRAAFRWRQLVALARVTASEYGRTAPGYKQARELLGLDK